MYSHYIIRNKKGKAPQALPTHYDGNIRIIDCAVPLPYIENAASLFLRRDSDSLR
jgi:hypothetical protein